MKMAVLGLVIGGIGICAMSYILRSAYNTPLVPVLALTFFGMGVGTNSQRIVDLLVRKGRSDIG